VDRAPATGDGPWKAELIDLVRAASGGLLFGVPLLYTMEVWWVGSRTGPERMLVLLAVLFVPLVALHATAGFRTIRDVRLRDAAADAVEAIAVGLVVTAGVLVLLREVTLDTPPMTALGKVLYESIPFCLGTGVARFLLEGDPGLEGDGDGDPSSSAGSGDGAAALSGTAADLGATAIGAAFIGLSIAPTDEVPMIAAAMSPGWQLVMVAASLVTSYAIVFVAGFARQGQRHAQEGVFQHPLTETVATYLLALLVAALLLWLFQRSGDPPDAFLAHVVVLGFPATIGGAVGRLAI
jgi:putative integral membrane protein (TIGR02587 family)